MISLKRLSRLNPKIIEFIFSDHLSIYDSEGREGTAISIGGERLSITRDDKLFSFDGREYAHNLDHFFVDEKVVIEFGIFM